MENYYVIRQCESCGKKADKNKVNIKDDGKIFIVCSECGAENSYDHSKHINENIESTFAIKEMGKFIYQLSVSRDIHYLVGRKNEINFIKSFHKNGGGGIKESMKAIIDFLTMKENEFFKDIERPLIPNYAYGVFSGLGVHETTYYKWFYEVLKTGVNPFNGKACLMSEAFYKFITIEDNGKTYIDWQLLWGYSDKHLGLRDTRDVLESERKKALANAEFYYQYAIENDLHREFAEVMNTHPENLSTEEKRFVAFFNMHTESDEYLERVAPMKDFWVACLSGPFKNGTTWKNEWFNLEKWNQCYWAHVIMLEKLTKGHPARSKNGVNFYIKL